MLPLLFLWATEYYWAAVSSRFDGDRTVQVLTSWLQQIVACEKDFDISQSLTLARTAQSWCWKDECVDVKWCEYAEGKWRICIGTRHSKCVPSSDMLCIALLFVLIVLSLFTLTPRLWVWGLQWQHHGHPRQCRPDRSMPQSLNLWTFKKFNHFDSFCALG